MDFDRFYMQGNLIPANQPSRRNVYFLGHGRSLGDIIHISNVKNNEVVSKDFHKKYDSPVVFSQVVSFLDYKRTDLSIDDINTVSRVLISHAM